ncbi:RluA family pseudouridine synthase [Lichenibacterium ramalinae]|uniref:Pseudouridine synthase n=1 Tax=Lichenibacterium ramalinae TaxID=2316527 RepID=A0A4Q2RJJ3_9HYPH|nr:RluA family pseudouridine synthase [Lichenibacterium ramalinae]RYB07245.1 RluA family pseudouridine synthase [Lichenibacterium ramalinae]
MTDDTDGPEISALSVGPDEAGQRLDKVLATHAAREELGLSRTRLQDLIGQGFVRIDGAVATNANAKLREGARILFEVPPPVDATPQPEAIPLDIVFEDDDLIVIDKPVGLVVHPAPGHATGTLVNALLHHCGAGLSGIGGIRRPGIVHRLDKDTSGLMVAAKTERAHRGLAETFADHGRSGSLVREYLAGVWTLPDRSFGTVDAAIGRHPHHRERMAVVPSAKGRHAVTHWAVEEKFPPVATLMRCRLETGRTHQIRVHMADIGQPLIGDMVYGAGFKTKAAALDEACRDAIAALGRQALHAAVLGFEHPVTGEEKLFESPLPADMQALVGALRGYAAK